MLISSNLLHTASKVTVTASILCQDFLFFILNVTVKSRDTVRRMNVQSPVEELALTDLLCPFFHQNHFSSPHLALRDNAIYKNVSFIAKYF